MKYKASVALQPVTHFPLLVGPRVVQDEMEPNFAGKHLIQIARKVEKLLMPIAVIAWANHLPPSGLQASEQSCGAAGLAVMGHGFHNGHF
jgi:hypothetical protein